MPFTFTPCSAGGTVIDGLFEVQPKVFGDNRGYFFEVYSEKEFKAAGLAMTFVQDNQSSSSKGVLRGLHFQTQHIRRGSLYGQYPDRYTTWPLISGTDPKRSAGITE